MDRIEKKPISNSLCTSQSAVRRFCMKLTRALQLSKDSFPSGIDSKEIYITHIVWSTCGYMRLSFAGFSFLLIVSLFIFEEYLFEAERVHLSQRPIYHSIDRITSIYRVKKYRLLPWSVEMKWIENVFDKESFNERNSNLAHQCYGEYILSSLSTYFIVFSLIFKDYLFEAHWVELMSSSNLPFDPWDYYVSWAQKHIDMLLNTMEMKWNESVVDKDNFSMKELITGKNAKEKILSQVT